MKPTCCRGCWPRNVARCSPSSSRSGADPIPYHFAPEGCESGRIGWSRKPLWRKSPWVQIPLPPLRKPRPEPRRGDGSTWGSGGEDFRANCRIPPIRELRVTHIGCIRVRDPHRTSPDLPTGPTVLLHLDGGVVAGVVASERTAVRSARFAASKFVAPQLVSRLVARSRLFDELDRGAGARLTVVVGAPGAGKST